MSDDLPAESWRTVRFGHGPEWSIDQVSLAVAACAGIALYLLALLQATGGFVGIWWFLALVPLAFIGHAGSALPLAVWAALLVVWYQLTPAGSFTWWSLPAAVGVAVAHTATALSASAPPATAFPQPTRRRWAQLAVAAALAAAPVAGLAGALAGRALEGGPAAYVLGLLGVGLGALWLRSAPVEPPD